MVVNSILQELQQHRDSLSKYEEMLRGTQPAEIRDVWGFFTDAFESSVSSGLFSLLPKETQTHLSAHYYGCSGINRLFTLVVYPARGEEYQSRRYKKDIVSAVLKLIPNIEPLIDHLKSILDTLNDEK